MSLPAQASSSSSVALSQEIQDALVTAVACIVAPQDMEVTVAAVPAESVLAVLWAADELVQRANALKKALVIEASVACEQGEIPVGNRSITVAGRKHIFKHDFKNEFDDVPLLMQELSNLGFLPYTLGRAVSYLRVTSLQDAIHEISDPDVRERAYALLKEHRVRKFTGWALVLQDNPHRKALER